jgi:hypothetical protein
VLLSIYFLDPQQSNRQVDLRYANGERWKERLNQCE